MFAFLFNQQPEIQKVFYKRFVRVRSLLGMNAFKSVFISVKTAESQL